MACVRYWAGARDVAGTPEQSLAATSLCALLAAVREEHGDRMGRLLEVGIVLVDGERADRGVDRALADSSVVEVLPPYAGG
ncbi:MAG TPA: MoaD/ThiS family protein [Mycobacteriales bacterium]|nr:MoaD/ThiS family protein [Mycobacteriales bacterium]